MSDYPLKAICLASSSTKFESTSLDIFLAGYSKDNNNNDNNNSNNNNNNNNIRLPMLSSCSLNFPIFHFPYSS